MAKLTGTVKTTKKHNLKRRTAMGVLLVQMFDDKCYKLNLEFTGSNKYLK